VGADIGEDGRSLGGQLSGRCRRRGQQDGNPGGFDATSKRWQLRVVSSAARSGEGVTTVGLLQGAADGAAALAARGRAGNERGRQWCR
jgi:hypothetical protein